MDDKTLKKYYEQTAEILDEITFIKNTRTKDISRRASMYANNCMSWAESAFEYISIYHDTIAANACIVEAREYLNLFKVYVND